MKNISFILVLTLFLSALHTNAEQQDSVKILNFRVVSEISGIPVELAHIINKTQRKDAIADMLGYFSIPVLDGDTISITSLGYCNKTVFSWGQFRNDSSFYTIKLIPKSYQLKELEVVWYSNYEKFLKGFLELRIPISKDEERIIRITDYFDRTIRKLNLLNLPNAGSGMGFGKDWLAQQNEMFTQRIEKESKQRAIERKYSAGIVSALTGLHGNEVHWFMEYCAFIDEYLSKASDYDIRTRILDKFKIYNVDKTSKEKK